jgi:hypothetical protein
MENNKQGKFVDRYDMQDWVETNVREMLPDGWRCMFDWVNNCMQTAAYITVYEWNDSAVCTGAVFGLPNEHLFVVDNEDVVETALNANDAYNEATWDDVRNEYVEIDGDEYYRLANMLSWEEMADAYTYEFDCQWNNYLAMQKEAA